MESGRRMGPYQLKLVLVRLVQTDPGDKSDTSVPQNNRLEQPTDRWSLFCTQRERANELFRGHNNLFLTRTRKTSK